MGQAVLQTKDGYNQYSACRVTPQKVHSTPRPAAPAAGHKAQPLIELHAVNQLAEVGSQEVTRVEQEVFTRLM